MRPRIKKPLLVATSSEKKEKLELVKQNYLLYLQSNLNPKTRHYIMMFGAKEYIPDNKIDLYKQGNFEIFTELVNN